ncbi:MAG: FtsX-like permease family protein [Acidobacteriota bacterium]
MNRHLWREVRRQLRESGPTGFVALVLVAVAATWGGVLWAARDWVMSDLLARGRPATVVAALRGGAAAQPLLDALHAEFPVMSARIVAPAATRDQLARWFPELASVLLGLDDSSFPTLLEASTDGDQAAAAAEWLRHRPEVILVENSRDWQGRLERTLSSVLLVGFGLAGVLLVGCSAVVLLVVRLLVLEHADEIAIMRLIGARERDIRLPYLACGAVLGLGGGLFAILALLALQAFLTGPTFRLSIPPALFGIIAALGATVGALGAALGLVALPEEP